MITKLDQIEDTLKRGYKKAILGFVKSSANHSISYFIEITKGAFDTIHDKIFLSKHEYFMVQDLVDKYDTLHKIHKDEEKERKAKAKEQRDAEEAKLLAIIDPKIRVIVKDKDIEDEEDEEEEDTEDEGKEEKLEIPEEDEDLVLGPEEIIPDDKIQTNMEMP